MKVLKEAKNSHIERNKRRNLGLAVVLLALSLGLVLLGFWVSIWLLAAAILPVAASPMFMRRYYTWSAGARGENVVARTLQQLDDSYYLLNSVVLPGRKGDIDHVLLSTKGVFVIEAKNYSGRVMCDGDHWYRVKRGSHNEVRAESVSEQVKKNAVHLRDFIQQTARLNLWVNPVCVFVNPSVQLELKNPTVPVLRPAELANFIRSARTSSNLSEDQLRELGQSIRAASG